LESQSTLTGFLPGCLTTAFITALVKVIGAGWAANGKYPNFSLTKIYFIKIFRQK
jgi:hypothetical protein